MTSNIIRRYRYSKGWSQHALASAWGVPQITISRWERTQDHKLPPRAVKLLIDNGVVSGALFAAQEEHLHARPIFYPGT